MNPLGNSVIGLIFLVIGIAATRIMLYLKGKEKDKILGRSLIRTHHILGYLFIGIYLFMVITMIVRVSHYQGELAVRAILHVVFALAIFPLLVVKISVARWHASLTKHLFPLGMTMMIFVFLLNAISAGHFFLYRDSVREVAISSLDKVTMNSDIGRQMVVIKCAKCHTLERVFKSFKDEVGWTDTVNRMALIDTPNIREYDAKQIIFFLVKQQENRKGGNIALVEEEIGKTLVEKKCTTCHDLDRVYRISRSEEEWSVTVERMKSHARDPKFLDDIESRELIQYLSDRSSPEK
jgi:cytochrome c2